MECFIIRLQANHACIVDTARTSLRLSRQPGHPDQVIDADDNQENILTGNRRPVGANGKSSWRTAMLPKAGATHLVVTAKLQDYLFLLGGLLRLPPGLGFFFWKCCGCAEQ